MILHVFNPEHDIALASNLERFTAPHAARQLRHDLGFLPALWAKCGEYVLVEDVDAAKEALRKTGLFRNGIAISANVVDHAWLSGKLHINPDANLTIQPWGWDGSIRSCLEGFGVKEQYLPEKIKLDTIRQMSHRAWAAENLLMPLRNIINGTVGESFKLHTLVELRDMLSERGNVVLKAPWSSSGRGIRYVYGMSGNGSDSDINGALTTHLEGWFNNVLHRQGCVMAEPYYDKVCDFGMEFECKCDGQISYRGLSLFSTSNGAYTGNILDDEEHKEALLCRYISGAKLQSIREKVKGLLSQAFQGKYSGFFGIDMMVVRNSDGTLAIHPCVELNLRMTMGHVANLLANKYELEDKVMRIAYSCGGYRLKIESHEAEGQ